MITTESSTEEMLDALHKATGELLSALDQRACFLTTHAMASASHVRKVRKIISHARRQRGSTNADSAGDRPV